MSVPIQYLAIGHVAKDLTPDGHRLGGTVAYAALTAQALGYTPGLVTAYSSDLNVEALQTVACVNVVSATSTTFENHYSPSGRTQFVRSTATPIVGQDVPTEWLTAPMAHLAPLAGELKADILYTLAGAFIGLTPQGWLRTWDAAGRVRRCAWPDALTVLPRVSATVISVEDVGGDWELIQQWAQAATILVVTDGPRGCTVLGCERAPETFLPPAQTEVDPTGAGDVFATAFFVGLHATHDPARAARFANALAAQSVTRIGLAGVPTAPEAAEARAWLA